ncbi:MAG TPA: hypothetical protein VKC60_04150 [Opitutaceae bacterium]|nr:hypothetical protein [Opitutaceae bacterium]
MKPERTHYRVNPVVALIALLLAIAWVPMVSHEILEAAGWIHQDGPDDGGPSHDGADGHVRLMDGGVFLKVPTFPLLGWTAMVVVFSLVSLVIESAVVSYLRRETESPPGFARTWQFILRLALPGRSPSFAS